MQQSQLQLYHNYKGMANNFLCMNRAFTPVYRNRTPVVLVTNSFVAIYRLIRW